MKRSRVLLFFILAVQISLAQNVGINTASPLSKLDINGDLALRSADITIGSVYSYALDVNTVKRSSYKLKAATLPVGNFILAGIAAGTDGRLVTLTNYTGSSFTIEDEDVTANAADRITTGTGNSIAVYPNGSVMFQYDVPENRWVVKASHNYSLNYYGGGGGGYFNASGDDIYNSNTGNVGVGLTNPARARLEVSGVAGTGYTSALFGSDGTGLSFQRNWPTIGFNQYRDGPGGWGKAIASGYGMHMYINPDVGAFAIDMNDSVGTDQPFAVAPKRGLTIFKNGFVHIGGNNVTDLASLSISGSSNFPSHFNYGSDGHTYIRGGSRDYRTIGVLQYRPSKVFINDISGYNFITGTTYPGGDVVMVTGGGSVGIGTETTTGYRLAVNGSVRAKEVRINTGWADYVFDEKYLLKPLKEVEAFILANKHLPGLLPASVVEREGADVGATQTKLLEKIEELTLYMIEANKAIAALQQKIAALETKK